LADGHTHTVSWSAAPARHPSRAGAPRCRASGDADTRVGGPGPTRGDHRRSDIKLHDCSRRS
jgi:hypothetical protein